MSALAPHEKLVPPALSPEQRETVRAAERLIMSSLDHAHAATITVVADDGSASPAVSVSPEVLRFLGQALGLVARGQPVVLVPEQSEFSTVEAANFLNVSRPFVIKEIERGRLPHRRVGTHRRILFADLLRYAKRMRAEQQSALDDMAAHAQQHGLNDD
jgi:excisionase family DNA binding protein